MSHFGADRGMKLNRIFKVADAGIDCLVDDLGVGSHDPEDVAEHHEGLVRSGSVLGLPNDVIDVVEADGRDVAGYLAAFSHGPELRGRRVERLSPGKHIEQDIRIDEDPHLRDLYLSDRASSMSLRSDRPLGSLTIPDALRVMGPSEDSLVLSDAVRDRRKRANIADTLVCRSAAMRFASRIKGFSALKVSFVVLIALLPLGGIRTVWLRGYVQ